MQGRSDWSLQELGQRLPALCHPPAEPREEISLQQELPGFKERQREELWGSGMLWGGSAEGRAKGGEGGVNWSRVRHRPEKANPSLTEQTLKGFGGFLCSGGAQIPVVSAVTP